MQVNVHATLNIKIFTIACIIASLLYVYISTMATCDVARLYSRQPALLFCSNVVELPRSQHLDGIEGSP
jgi:hypothetical protein